MRKFIFCTAATLLFAAAFCQPGSTMRIDNLKDAWGEPGSYVGQVKNGKPNGLGTFLYRNGHALRYVGYFAEGKPNGKGAVMFSDGSFLWGDWVNGKLNGKGANFTASGSLYVGGFANGVKKGKGILFFKDNGFVVGEYANDMMEGRAVYIGSDGKIVNDNFYHNDKKDGYGYQYEVDGKKFYKGIWKAGTWQGSAEPPYKSFMTDSRFYGESTEKQILIGNVNTHHKLEDTAFFRDLVNRKRYFGNYENGRLRNGFIIRDDSSVFVGALNDKGSFGPGSFLKRGKFYDEGIYLEDFLNGPQSLSIDLAKGAVYYGSAVNKGEFSGKSWFSNKTGVLYNGDYLQGKFTGTGWRIDTLGFCTAGTWKDGKLTSFSYVTLPNGKSINTSPATLAEAISQLMQLDFVGFEPVEGSPVDDWTLGKFQHVNKSYYRMVPGSRGDYLADYEGDYVQLSIVHQGTDPKAASAKYAELCRQLAALSINYKGTIMKLATKDKMTVEDPDKSITYFSLTPDKSNEWEDFKIVVVELKNPGTGEYAVLIGAGVVLTFDDWMSSFKQ